MFARLKRIKIMILKNIMSKPFLDPVKNIAGIINKDSIILIFLEL